FNNHWLNHSGFKKVVEESWRCSSITGWMGNVIKEKLKGLKLKIKGWNYEIYGGIDFKIKQLYDKISFLDIQGELQGLNDQEVATRKRLFGDLWHLLKSKESVSFQRSRSRWLKEGDANTRFFHSCVKLRGKRNLIRALKVEGGWVESPEAVRNHTVEFFRNHFKSVVWPRPHLDGIAFPTLSEEQNLGLSRPFALEEINMTISESDGNKSPGPD
ncbi:RNA-directed DNA polymerase (Reverse transcriptase), partial [Trifolium medium]|nr:RNA-directed DNA polymerase (Reverse transcriptase) [Trifolium medium]